MYFYCGIKAALTECSSTSWLSNTMPWTQAMAFASKLERLFPSLAFHIERAHAIKDDDLNASLYGNVGHSHDPTGLLGSSPLSFW